MKRKLIFGLLFLVLLSSVSLATLCSDNGGVCTFSCNTARGDIISVYTCYTGGGGSPMMRNVYKVAIAPDYNEILYSSNSIIGSVNIDGSAIATDLKTTNNLITTTIDGLDVLPVDSLDMLPVDSLDMLPVESVIDSDNEITTTVPVYSCCIVNYAPTLSLPDNYNLYNYITYAPIDLTQYSNDSVSLTYTVISDDVSKVDCQIVGNQLTFVPNPSFTGTASCVINASDGYLTAQDTVNFNVYGMIAYNGTPNQIISSTSTVISINSKMQAVCGYSIGTDKSFDQMTLFSTADGFYHTANVNDLTDGYKTVYAKCRNTTEITDQASYSWQFYDDLAAPVIASFGPSRTYWSSYLSRNFYMVNGSEFPLYLFFNDSDVYKVEFKWWNGTFTNPSHLAWIIYNVNNSFVPYKNFSIIINSSPYESGAIYYLNMTAYDFSNHTTSLVLPIDIDNDPPNPVFNITITQGNTNGKLTINWTEPSDESWINFSVDHYDVKTWCPTNFINLGCPVAHRYIKFIEQDPDIQTNPFVNEAAFWAARNLNEVVTVPDPQATNTSMSVTATFTPNRTVFFAFWADDEFGNKFQFEWVNSTYNIQNGMTHGMGHNLTPLRNITLMGASCYKYDSYGFAHDCNESFNPNFNPTPTLSLYLFDNLNITGTVKNSGNLNTLYFLRVNSINGNNYYIDQLAPNSMKQISFIWNPYISLRNYYPLYPYAAEGNIDISGYNCDNIICYKILEITKNWIISIREFTNSFVWNSLTDPPGSININQAFFVKTNLDMRTPPYTYQNAVLREVPLRLIINGTYNITAKANIDRCINYPSTGQWFNGRTSCFRNISVSNSQDQIIPSWKINITTPGVYNITVIVGNDGDEKWLSRTIIVNPVSKSLSQINNLKNLFGIVVKTAD